MAVFICVFILFEKEKIYIIQKARIKRGKEEGGKNFGGEKKRGIAKSRLASEGVPVVA